MDVATKQMQEELHRAIDRLRVDLARVEILSAALGAFARPVPDYEPTFRHTQKLTRSVHDLGRAE
jgi:hypothetical protein